MNRNGGQNLISRRLAEFLQSGLSIAVAARDGGLRPSGARAWAATVEEDGSHLTVFLYAKSAESILRDLRKRPPVAVVFDRPTDARACQIKGTFAGSRRARPEERGELERQVGGLFEQLGKIGFPRTLLTGWKFWPAAAIRIRVTDLFQQTPGPGAGEPMR